MENSLTGEQDGGQANGLGHNVSYTQFLVENVAFRQHNCLQTIQLESCCFFCKTN